MTAHIPIRDHIHINDRYEIDDRSKNALTRMATLGAEAAIAAAHTLEAMSRCHKRDGRTGTAELLATAAYILRGEAGRGRDVVQQVEDGVTYNIPEDA